MYKKTKKNVKEEEEARIAGIYALLFSFTMTVLRQSWLIVEQWSSHRLYLVSVTNWEEQEHRCRRWLSQWQVFLARILWPNVDCKRKKNYGKCLFLLFFLHPSLSSFFFFDYSFESIHIQSFSNHPQTRQLETDMYVSRQKPWPCYTKREYVWCRRCPIPAPINTSNETVERLLCRRIWDY